MIEWAPELRPADLQSRLARQVLRAWDALPRRERNVRRIVAHWTQDGRRQRLVRLEPVR